mmetsp:Transcript_8122/g.18567  ORF Transcript_8122/g.18567 Transcript_8122/m.18567 type:complete len:107 (+) Transcript_8122:38-358(+)
MYEQVVPPVERKFARCEDGRQSRRGKAPSDQSIASSVVVSACAPTTKHYKNLWSKSINQLQHAHDGHIIPAQQQTNGSPVQTNGTRRAAESAGTEADWSAWISWGW